MESGFGEGEMLHRNPVSELRISYRAIKSMTAHGEFVFMRQQGVPLTGTYPRELFPDEAIDRIVERKGR